MNSPDKNPEQSKSELRMLLMTYWDPIGVNGFQRPLTSTTHIWVLWQRSFVKGPTHMGYLNTFPKCRASGWRYPREMISLPTLASG